MQTPPPFRQCMGTHWRCPSEPHKHQLDLRGTKEMTTPCLIHHVVISFVALTFRGCCTTAHHHRLSTSACGTTVGKSAPVTKRSDPYTTTAFPPMHVNPLEFPPPTPPPTAYTAVVLILNDIVEY